MPRVNPAIALLLAWPAWAAAQQPARLQPPPARSQPAAHRPARFGGMPPQYGAAFARPGSPLSPARVRSSRAVALSRRPLGLVPIVLLPR